MSCNFFLSFDKNDLLSKYHKNTQSKREELENNLGRDVLFQQQQFLFKPADISQRHRVKSQIHLSSRQLVTGRIESARQIVGRVNKAKVEEKEGDELLVREEESIQGRRRRRRTRRRKRRRRKRKDEGGRTEGRARERMSVGTFHSLSQQRGPRVASQTETGDRGLCMNFRSWLRGDKQIASYFCIQRLNGRRVWNDAPARYKRPLLANTDGEWHAWRIPTLSSCPAEFELFLSLISTGSAISVAKESDRGKKEIPRTLGVIKPRRTFPREKLKKESH